MSKFVLGAIVIIVVVIVIACGVILLGYLPTTAGVEPPRWEAQIANVALDASMEKHAPRVNNPVPATDENLIAGMKIYVKNCALCHGDLDRQTATLSRSLYPPAPNLITHPLDDPEWHVFYAIRTGVRYTGMPAWEKVLPESDIWKLTAFLTRIEKLPAAVQDYWKNASGVAPPAESGEHHSHKEHD
jgi:mono/diheme cytochrome c family protein